MKYTTDEALSEIMQRKRSIIVQRKKRTNRILSCAAGVLTIALAVVILKVTTDSPSSGTPGTVYGSFMLGLESGGYVLTALLAFILGIIVTLLCLRYKKSKDDNIKPTA